MLTALRGTPGEQAALSSWHGFSSMSERVWFEPLLQTVHARIDQAVFGGGRILEHFLHGNCFNTLSVLFAQNESESGAEYEVKTIRNRSASDHF